MVDLGLLTMLIFFAIVGILLLRDRKKVEFHAGVVIRRWKRGLELIDILVKKHTKAIKISGYIAVVVGFLAGLVGFVYLIILTVKLQQAFALVLPTAAGYQYPGPIIGVPFWYWLIAIFVILFSHETMHGIFARAAKVPLKNYGILLFFLLPIGAFVEPDTKKVEKLKTYPKIRFLAAGSFANFIVAVIVFVLALLISKTFFVPSGVAFMGTSENYPANKTNLTGIIKEVNGIEIKTIEDLSKILNQTKVGEKITITTTKGNYTLTTVQRPDNQSGSYIGIESPFTYFDVIPIAQNFKPALIVVTRLFWWLFFLNIGVGIANLLPLKPFDGGLIYEEIFTKMFGKNGKFISNILTYFVVALLLFNLFGTRIIG